MDQEPERRGPETRTPTPWPDFIIGGAPKCGTTALFSYLRQHPGIYGSDPKEPHYFASAAMGQRVMQGDYSREEYQAFFAGAAEDQLAGEGSTHYLHLAEAVAPLMASLVPDVRLVFCLRDPVERAYSHYLFRYSCAGPYTRGGVGSGESFQQFALDPEIFGMGDYAANLEGFDRHFDRDQITVVLVDDLRRDLSGELARVCRHIGVDDRFDFDVSYRVNETQYVRWPWAMPLADLMTSAAYRATSRRPHRRALIRARRRWLFAATSPKPPLPKASRAALVAHYAASIDALEERLGRDLAAWRTHE